MLIDTHCHLDFKDFEYDRDDVIERSKREGVGIIINVGSSLEGTKKSIEIADNNEFIYASAGIHPHEADIVKTEHLELFKNFTAREKVVAIGEIGLDYYKDFSSKDNQKALFINLLNIANQKALPVIIHNRDAHEDTIAILREEMGMSIRGVLHCFSGDERFLERCMDMGLFISFTCNLTFKNSGMLRRLADLVPMERLLLETDSPFLAPQVFRGSRNEPGYVKFLAEEIARIKGVALEEVARVTTENAKALFKFKK